MIVPEMPLGIGISEKNKFATNEKSNNPMSSSNIPMFPFFLNS